MDERARMPAGESDLPPERKAFQAGGKTIVPVRPEPEDLWFREALLGDPETMSYNRAWGGTIPFPESRWEEWYTHWVLHHENKRFYRYLRDTETDAFVGEIAYHLDEKQGIWLADVIIAAKYRGRGFGTAGLRLLCEAAREKGIDVLRDDIAADNPALKLFLRAGFTEEYRTETIIMLMKKLS